MRRLKGSSTGMPSVYWRLTKTYTRTTVKFVRLTVLDGAFRTEGLQ